MIASRRHALPITNRAWPKTYQFKNVAVLGLRPSFQKGIHVVVNLQQEILYHIKLVIALKLIKLSCNFDTPITPMISSDSNCY